MKYQAFKYCEFKAPPGSIEKFLQQAAEVFLDNKFSLCIYNSWNVGEFLKYFDRRVEASQARGICVPLGGLFDSLEAIYRWIRMTNFDI
jgi:hypothetical protein